MKHLLLALLFSFPILAISQMNDPIQKLCDSIAYYKEIPSSQEGRFALPSLNYSFYEELISLASDSTLLSLTFHTYSVIRATAFKGLHEKHPNQFIEAMPYSVGDTSIVQIANGCFVSRYTVDEYVTCLAFNLVKKSKPNYISKEEEVYITNRYNAFRDRIFKAKKRTTSN